MVVKPGVTAVLEDTPLMASITRCFQTGSEGAMNAGSGFLVQGRRKVRRRQTGPGRQREKGESVGTAGAVDGRALSHREWGRAWGGAGCSTRPLSGPHDGPGRMRRGGWRGTGPPMAQGQIQAPKKKKRHGLAVVLGLKGRKMKFLKENFFSIFLSFKTWLNSNKI